MNNSDFEPVRVWRRIHRPEDYAADAAKFVAREIHIPFIFLKPFVPIARKILAGWDDAAIETTALYETPEGKRTLRTFFLITDYSNDAVYGMIERILKRMGVGARLSRNDETDFAWVLLGGVLTDYAESAGVCKRTTRRLNEFRLPLSDYFTATTWETEYVEITNLRTGRVERMYIPARDICTIINWSVNFEEQISCCKSKTIEKGTTEYHEFLKLNAKYHEMKLYRPAANL